MDKKYCDGLDCDMCGESEPCIYREANELQKQLKRKEQECEKLKVEVKKQKEIAKEYEQRWLNSYGI